MKARKSMIILAFIFSLSILVIYKLQNQVKYIVVSSTSNSITRIFKDGERSYYLDGLDSFDISKNGRKISLSSSLSKGQITLEELLRNAKKETADVNGVMYSYDTFSIYVCQKIYEDHVKPNKDVIIGPKNFQIDFTKHCQNH